MEAPEAVPAPQDVAMDAVADEAPAEGEPAAAEEEPAAAEEAGTEADTAPAPASTEKAAKTPAAAAGRAKAKATPATDGGTSTGGRAQRERKKVEFFQPVQPAKKDVEEVLAVGAGSGSKLRDIPNVAFKLSKVTGKDELVEGLHNLIFRRKGAAMQRKKAVLDFSGFAFSDDQRDKEIEARRASLSKWKLELVHRALDTLDLPRGSGDKAAKVDRILDFLQEPKALSDVDLASKEASKKEKGKAKRERAATKKEKEKAKKDKEKAKAEKGSKRKSGGSAVRPAKKAKMEEGEESEGAEEESEPEEEAEASEEEESEEEKVPAKKDRRSAGGGRGKKAAAEEEEGGEQAQAMEEDAAPEEAEATPASEVPADELAAAVQAVLAEVSGDQLTAMTTKPLIKKMEEKYGFSLKSRKKEIVATAQSFVEAYLEANPERQAAVEDISAAEAAAPPAATEAAEEALPATEEADAAAAAPEAEAEAAAVPAEPAEAEEAAAEGAAAVGGAGDAAVPEEQV